MLSDYIYTLEFGLKKMLSDFIYTLEFGQKKNFKWFYIYTAKSYHVYFKVINVYLDDTNDICNIEIHFLTLRYTFIN